MTRLPGYRAAPVDTARAPDGWSIADERWYWQRPFVYAMRADGEGFGVISRVLNQPVWRVRAWDERVQRRINAAADFAFPPHPAPKVDWGEVAIREANRAGRAAARPWIEGLGL